jgi:hypothetical protein
MPRESRFTVGGVAEMITRGSLVALVAGLSACSTVTPGSPSPLPWNPGEYRFDGTYYFEYDTEHRLWTERSTFSGGVTVERKGPVSVESTLGTCGEPGPELAEQDQARGTRSFRCGAGLVTLRPLRVDVGVDVTIDVAERIRRRSGCAVVEETRTGLRRCRQPSYIIEIRSRSVRARVSLRREG